MNSNSTSSVPALRRSPFLLGVFFITFSVLVFQIVQTRVLSVIAWYYLAFFAISIAMLGMTVGAVWVYLKPERFKPERLAQNLAGFTLATALAMPISLVFQFSLITAMTPTISTIGAWSILMVSMALPYVFAGVAVSLALTRSPFSVTQVYGVDMLGAALGCAAVIALLNVLDGPSAIIFAGGIAALASAAFAASAGDASTAGKCAPTSRRSLCVALGLAVLALLNSLTPYGLRPVMVKDQIEHGTSKRYEKWNSYSRIVASPIVNTAPYLWGPSPMMPQNLMAPAAMLNIDGAAGTMMQHYDGTRASIDFLRYDLVTLAYNLPGIKKSAVIGVGGGRDLMSAYLFGVSDITGVELNPIFVNLLTKHPVYKEFSNLNAIPNLKLHVDDARSWFASTPEKFDLIQMSMIDTWAATGAGAFSLSENGLYTLDGWRAFIGRLNDNGIFTVSRWYSPKDLNETGRMVALAAAAVLDAGNKDAASHLFVARADHIATLVLSKSPFTPEQLRVLEEQTQKLGFGILLAPDRAAETPLMRDIVAAHSIEEINKIAATSYLDMSVPTDNRPFFFNQLRFSNVLNAVKRMKNGELSEGVIRGNIVASSVLVLILVLSLIAVVLTILVPLRSAAKAAPRGLVRAGSTYFALIGLGFMFAEISLLQYFSVYLGHPIYSLGVCLFSLIFATGLGALVSGKIGIDKRGNFIIWSLLLGAYLLIAQYGLTSLFAATTAQALHIRIAISLVVVMPGGFLMGFAFPSGMRMIETIDRGPTPWFWGINGATGVLASVLAVMTSMAFGINITMTLAGLCYLALIPVALSLIELGARGGK